MNDPSTTLTPDQVAERMSGIGASEVAAIVGEHPWKTALEVWEEKTGRRPIEALARIPTMPKTDHMERPVTDYVYFGILGEDEVADTFARVSGKRVQRWRRAYRLKDSVMLAHTDRKVVGEEALLEAKTTNAFARWAWDASVPDMYHIQCQSLLLTSGHKRCYFATRIAGQSYFHTYIEPHTGQQEALRYACEKFWQDCVVADRRPTPTAQDDFSRIYHDAGTTADYEEELHRDALVRLRATRIDAREAEKAKKAAEADVKMLLADNGQLLGPRGKPLVTWKNDERRKLNQDSYITAMAAHFSPDIVETVTAQSMVSVVDKDALQTALELLGTARENLPAGWPRKSDHEYPPTRRFLPKLPEILRTCGE